MNDDNVKEPKYFAIYNPDPRNQSERTVIPCLNERDAIIRSGIPNMVIVKVVKVKEVIED